MRAPLLCSRSRLAIGMVLLLVSPAALAQAVDPQVEVTAQALFNRAVAEMDEERYASACPRLEEVARLIPQGIGAKEALAECYEGMGRLASAWSQYLVAETLARRAGDEKRAAEDAARAAALEPRLARLTIEVPEAIGGLQRIEIKRDGVSLGRAGWETPTAVDSGPHVIEVKAPRRRALRHAIVVQDGAQVTWRVPPLEADPPAGDRPERAATPLPPPPVRSWQRPLAYGAIGVGLAGLGAAGALSLAAVLKKNESNDGHCNAHNKCTGTGLALRDQAVDLGHGATAALVVGGALLSGGALLLLTAPPQGKSPGRGKTAGGIQARIELSPSGVRVIGAW